MEMGADSRGGAHHHRNCGGGVGLVDRVEQRLSRAVPVPVVTPWQQGEAYSREEWAPAAYGEYLATSNDVYSCAWLRAKNLAKLPLLVRKKETTVESGPLTDLLARPNPHWSRQRLIAFIELCLAVWGEYAVLLDKGMTGGPSAAPKELWPCRPSDLKAVADKKDFIRGWEYTPPGGGTPVPLRLDEVIYDAYPNPNDLYAPLVPMAAVRLAAEVASEAMKANRKMFSQGMMAGGFIMPPDKDSQYSDEQAAELNEMMTRRFSGTGNAHRWQTLKYYLTLKEAGVSPKDAQWIEGSNLTFRQVCRGMGVPPPLVGDAEYATLANLEVYERALWEHTLSFETEFVAGGFTRQLAPVFGVDEIMFDLGAVVALQEDEDARWGRAEKQIELGAITINEWREVEGLGKVAWGDVWWAPFNKAPVQNDSPAEPVQPRVWARAVRPRPLVVIEDQMRDTLGAVTVRLKDAVLQQLRQGERSVLGSAEEPFDKARWQERMRQAVHSHSQAAALWVAEHEAELLGLSPEQIARLLASKTLLAAVETLAQTFAREVVQTTWDAVREAIAEGARLGEDFEQISMRVSHVMDVRIEDARRTASTEITRASSTGQLAAFNAGGVQRKRWVTMADGNVRDSHTPLHGVEIGVAEMFTVGGYQSAGPGLSGQPSEDIGCRCILQPAAGSVKAAGSALVALRDALEVK